MTTDNDTDLADSSNVSVFQENQKGWLQQSEENYFKKNYSACLEYIKHLQSSLKKHPISNQKNQKFIIESKISMNHALCELASSSYKNHDQLKDELQRIVKEQATLSSKSESPLKTNLEESQLAYIYYNLAVLHYYNKEYGKALKIIEEIYNSFNELIDEKLSRQITALYIDLLIFTNQPIEALGVLQNFEKVLARKKTAASNVTSSKKSENDAIEEDLTKYQQLISIFKLKCYFSLNTTKFNEKEFKLLSTYGDNIESEVVSNLTAQSEYLAGNYNECLKQIILELHKDLSESSINGSLSADLIQQLNSLSTTSTSLNLTVTTPGSQNSINDFLLFLLKTTSNLSSLLETKLDTDNNKKQTASTSEDLKSMKSLTSLFFNNIALVHHAIGKQRLSSLYFQRALRENAKFISKYLHTQNAKDEIGKNKKGPEVSDNGKNYLNTRLMNRHYEILFNMGLSLLFGKQPIAAFECLFKATTVFGQNARLWLRLAECCIMCYRHSIEQVNSDSTNEARTTAPESTSTISNNEKIFKLSEKIKCIHKSFGTGFHHKIQFGTSLTHDLKMSNVVLGDMNVDESNAELIPKLVTLDFAYMCLRNALRLLPSNNELICLTTGRKPSSNVDFLTKSSSNLEDNLDNAYTLSDFDIENSTTNSTEQINDAIQATFMDTNELSPKTLNKSKHHGPHLFDCVWPSKPIGLSEVQALRSSILISIAYVSLCLKDFSGTIKYCNMLLSEEDVLNSKFPIAKGNKYLANFYMAEALLLSDKLNESLDHLNMNTRIDSESDLSFVSRNNNSSPSEEQSIEDSNEKLKKEETLNSLNQNKWYPKSLNSAKAIAYYNLSVLHAVRSEIDMAYRNFNISVNLFEKQPAHTYFMKLYLDLLDGYRQSIQVVLKENFGHVTNSHNLHKPLHQTSSTNPKQPASQLNPIQQLQQQLQQQQLQQQLHLQQQQLQQLQFQSSQSQLAPTQQHLMNQQQIQLQQLQLQQLQHQLQQHQLQQQQPPPPHLIQPQGLNSTNPNTNSGFANLANVSNMNLFSSLAAAVVASNSNQVPNSNLANTLNINHQLLQQPQSQQQAPFLGQASLPSRIN